MSAIHRKCPLSEGPKSKQGSSPPPQLPQEPPPDGSKRRSGIEHGASDWADAAAFEKDHAKARTITKKTFYDKVSRGRGMFDSSMIVAQYSNNWSGAPPSAASVCHTRHEYHEDYQQITVQNVADSFHVNWIVATCEKRSNFASGSTGSGWHRAVIDNGETAPLRQQRLRSDREPGQRIRKSLCPIRSSPMALFIRKDVYCGLDVATTALSKTRCSFLVLSIDPVSLHIPVAGSPSGRAVDAA